MLIKLSSQPYEKRPYKSPYVADDIETFATSGTRFAKIVFEDRTPHALYVACKKYLKDNDPRLDHIKCRSISSVMVTPEGKKRSVTKLVYLENTAIPDQIQDFAVEAQ